MTKARGVKFRLDGQEHGHILLLLALRLFQGHPVTAKYIRERFNVSRPTAHRYMLRLEAALPVRCEEREWRAGCIPIRTLRWDTGPHFLPVLARVAD